MVARRLCMCLRVVCGIGPALPLLPLVPHALRKPVPSTFSSPSYHPTRPCRLSLTRWSQFLLESCGCGGEFWVVSDLLYKTSHSYCMRCASPFPLLSPRLHTTPLALVVSHSPGGHYGC